MAEIEGGDTSWIPQRYHKDTTWIPQPLGQWTHLDTTTPPGSFPTATRLFSTKRAVRLIIGALNSSQSYETFFDLILSSQQTCFIHIFYRHRRLRIFFGKPCVNEQILQIVHFLSQKMWSCKLFDKLYVSLYSTPAYHICKGNADQNPI